MTLLVRTGGVNSARQSGKMDGITTQCGEPKDVRYGEFGDACLRARRHQVKSRISG